MLSTRWVFQATNLSESKSRILALLSGSKEVVAKLAVSKPPMREGFLVPQLASDTFHGYLESFTPILDTECNELIPGAIWGSVTADNPNLAQLFSHADQYDWFVHENCGVHVDPYEQGDMDVDEDSYPVEDPVDFLLLAETSNDGFERQPLPSSLSSVSTVVAKQATVESYYSPSNLQQWNDRGFEYYSSFIAACPAGDRHPIQQELRMQSELPCCYPFTCRPVEYRQYHLQLAMVRMDFAQLLANFASTIIHLHPASMWYKTTDMDDHIKLLFGFSDGGDYPDALPLLRRQLSIDYLPDCPDAVFDLATALPGGILQPFCRVWKSMLNVDYEPGLRNRSVALSPWDTAIKSWKLQEAHLLQINSWTCNSHTWVKSAATKCWSQSGALSVCLVDLADALADHVIKFSSDEKQAFASSCLDSLSETERDGNSIIKLSMLRSKHISLRSSHLFVVTCVLLNNLFQISSCGKFDILLVRWTLRGLFNMTMIKQMLLVQEDCYTDLLCNLYDKANLSMVLLQLWRISLVLPVVLRYVYGISETDEYSLLMRWADQLQARAKEMCCGDVCTTSQQHRSSFTPSWMATKNASLFCKCSAWLATLSHFSIHLVAWLYSGSLDSFSKDAQWEDSSIFRGPNGQSPLANHLWVCKQANKALVVIESIINM